MKMRCSTFCPHPPLQDVPSVVQQTDSYFCLLTFMIDLTFDKMKVPHAEKVKVGAILVDPLPGCIKASLTLSIPQ